MDTIRTTDGRMIVELSRTEAQVIAAACDLAVHDWCKGDTYAQLCASILAGIRDDLVKTVLAMPTNGGSSCPTTTGTRQAYRD